MAKILVIADIYFETQYFVDEIPGSNEFTFSDSVTNIVGSKTINAARILSRDQNVVNIFGKVGNDNVGIKAISDLREGYNLNVENVSTIPMSSTGQISVITDSQGESGITLFRGANSLFSEKDVNHIETLLEEIDLVYCATNLNLDLLYKLIDVVYKHKVPIFIDVPNQHESINLEKMSNTTFFAPNRQEAELLLSKTIRNIDNAKDACMELRKFIKGNIIITIDVDGCVVLKKDSNQTDHFSVNRQNSIDSTGAGDIFRAIFVSEYLKSNNFDQSINRAIRVSSKSVLIKGVDNKIRNLEIN